MALCCSQCNGACQLFGTGRHLLNLTIIAKLQNPISQQFFGSLLSRGQHKTSNCQSAISHALECNQIWAKMHFAKWCSSKCGTLRKPCLAKYFPRISPAQTEEQLSQLCPRKTVTFIAGAASSSMTSKFCIALLTYHFITSEADLCKERAETCSSTSKYHARSPWTKLLNDMERRAPACLEETKE